MNRPSKTIQSKSHVATIFGQGVVFLVLMAVVFIGGFSYTDIQYGVRHPEYLSLTLQQIPERLRLSLHDVAVADSDTQSSPLDVYASVLETVQSEFYGSLPSVPKTDSSPAIDSDHFLTYSAIRGMMGSLGDRYTRFLDPRDYSDMEDDEQGQFVGIGAQLDENKKNQIYIVKPLPNSPAIKAHVMAGDIILKVDDKAVLGMDITRVVSMIRGNPHTPVTLTVARQGAANPIKIQIIRDFVHQEVVVWKMIDTQHKIGYIALFQFNEESDPQIDHALTELQKQGMKALVFDLRGNPGGLLNVAQDVASRFVDNGPIVWEKERGGELHSLDVEIKQHNHPHYPVAVLVNGGSASAAEITSGAIKDDKAGVLIGETTFGKGLVQTVIPLPDHSAVAITTAHYYTPLKHDINHIGILPDIPVSLTADDEKNINQYAQSHPDDTVDLMYDSQLKKAVSNLVSRQAAGEHPEGWD
jgi:carboxyl-terminal processing protease